MYSYNMITKEKVDDYTKIDYSIPKVNRENYTTFKEYFQARSNYVQLKFKDTYGSKESSS
jgi:hypothetical protein